MSKSFFTAFLFFLFALAADEEIGLISSSPDQIASLNYDPGLLIGGCIHPASGQLCLSSVDLVAKGAQELSLFRVYIPPVVILPPLVNSEMEEYYNERSFLMALQKNHRGWVFLPHLKLERRGSETKVPDSNGAIYSFSKGKLIHTSGMSNISGDVPSGKSDPRNIRISEETFSITVLLPNGTKRFYNHHERIFYNLVKEVLPNGKVIKYTYLDNQILIQSLDPSEKHIYASLTIDTSSYKNSFHVFDKTKKGSCGKYENTEGEIKWSSTGVPYLAVLSAKTNTGLTASYQYESTDRCKEISKKCGKFKHEFSFIPNLKGASTPAYRNETFEYENYLPKVHLGKSAFVKASYEGTPSRIKTLQFPNGENDAFIPLYTLDVQTGTTTVSHEDGCKTVYAFSAQRLPLSIQSMAPDGKVVKVKVYCWDAQNRLSSIEWKDGCNRTFWKRTYEDYDLFNNPQKETFSGDLAGSGQNETYRISRKFSQDGLNLLLQEETEDGLTTAFQYLEKTNLLKSKCTTGKDVSIRETYEYDDANCLKKKFVDDGALQKLTTVYILRQEHPFLHMPEWIIESSDAGLLKKTKLGYDRYGNVCQEDIYGSDGLLAYSVLRSHDEQGNILSETNPLGLTASSTYHARGFPNESENFSKRLKTKREYNAAGQLKKITETGDGIARTTLYNYNRMGRLEKETDPLENVIQYKEYDCVANQPTLTEFPPIDSIDGKHSVVGKKSYDGLGRIIERTDANKQVTKYKYNAYGSPLEITYPNGSKETFLYYKNGELKSHTNRENLVTEFSYDVLKRVTGKRYLFEGKLLADETFVYNSFHLKSHTDKEGYVTKYEYNSAGRRIEENREGRVVVFGYDVLGRPSRQTHMNGVQIVSQFDAVGNLKEKQKTNASDKVLHRVSYTYNADGDQESITYYPNNIPAKTTFSYDPLRRLIEVADPLGFTTSTTYDESKTNSLGQRILTKTITDPNNISTVITYDPYDREATRKISTLRTEERFYDPAGNLLQITEGTRVTRYTYNSLNLTETLTRAFGTPASRVTTYSYTPSGLLKTKVQPNGITLNYTYDPYNHPKTLVSSDGALSHLFIYNSNGDLLHASDNRHTVDRTLDPFGNTLTETIDGKLFLSKTYDCLDRPLTLTLPDQSSLRYSYDPVYLKTVERLSSSGEVLYAHAYESYDLNGAILTEILPFNLGVQSHSYDSNRRLHSLSSPYFSQTLFYDQGGRVKNISSEGSFTYDDLDELTSESSHTYSYDCRYNRRAKDREVLIHNELDEVLTLSFDMNGNLAQKGSYGLTYDPLNRLINAESDRELLTFSYDPLGRRLCKASDETELYIYDGVNEVASLHSNGTLKDIRVPGYSNPIAIELGEKVFIPISDCRGNIRKLIDPFAQIFQSYDYTAFGEETTLITRPYNPWRYAGKRFDVELGLSYFGHRYYDANLGRWISTDPAGFVDGMNLYAYVLNNPLGFFDPDGRSVGGFVLGLGEIVLGGTLMITGGILEVASFGAYTIGFGFQEAAGLALIGHGLSLTTNHAQDISFSRSRRGSVEDWGLGGTSSMPQIASNGYGGVIVKNDQMSQNEKKQAPRTEPKNLQEQLALDEATGGAGKEIDKLKDKIKDPKYPKEIWEKQQHLHENSNGTNINIHYWENRQTGMREGFKFKNE